MGWLLISFTTGRREHKTLGQNHPKLVRFIVKILTCYRRVKGEDIFKVKGEDIFKVGAKQF